jgi:hypothetical protein
VRNTIATSRRIPYRPSVVRMSVSFHRCNCPPCIIHDRSCAKVFVEISSVSGTSRKIWTQHFKYKEMPPSERNHASECQCLAFKHTQLLVKGTRPTAIGAMRDTNKARTRVRAARAIAISQQEDASMMTGEKLETRLPTARQRQQVLYVRR